MCFGAQALVLLLWKLLSLHWIILYLVYSRWLWNSFLPCVFKPDVVAEDVQGKWHECQWQSSQAAVIRAACCFRSCNLLRYISLTQKHTAWKDDCWGFLVRGDCFRLHKIRICAIQSLLLSGSFSFMLSNADSCGLACIHWSILSNVVLKFFL